MVIILPDKQFKGVIMLIRDKVVENKEFDNKGIEKSTNNSELLLLRKRTLQDKIEDVINDTATKNEQKLLSDTADAIEMLISNVRTQGISEEKLVSIMEQKSKMFGSYDEGYVKK